MFDKLASMTGNTPMTVNTNSKKTFDRESAERQGLADAQSSATPGQSTTIQSETVALQATTRVQPTQETAETQQSRTDSQKNLSERLSEEEKAVLSKSIEGLNETASGFDVAVQFNVHEKYEEMVIQVVDKESDEVIRQIPAEEALAIASFFNDLQTVRKTQDTSSSNQDMPKDKKPKLEGILLNTQA
jgi:flagellar protein FlaG